MYCRDGVDHRRGLRALLLRGVRRVFRSVRVGKGVQGKMVRQKVVVEMRKHMPGIWIGASLLTGTALVDHFMGTYPARMQLLGYAVCFVVTGLGLRYWNNRSPPAGR